MSKHTAKTKRRRFPRAFTLTELMVTLTIVSALAAMSVPSFQRAIEQSRADIAVANLRAIWSAERLYWLEYRTFTSDIDTLQGLGVLDNAIPASSSESIGGYKYGVSASSADFTATATHANGLGSFSIAETGNVSGSISVGGRSISPGFQ